MSTMPMMSAKPRAWTSLGDALRAMRARLGTPFHKDNHVCGEGFLPNAETPLPVRASRGEGEDPFLPAAVLDSMAVPTGPGCGQRSARKVGEQLGVDKRQALAKSFSRPHR